MSVLNLIGLPLDFLVWVLLVLQLDLDLLILEVFSCVDQASCDLLRQHAHLPPGAELGHDAYTVKLDGSGRISKRKRRFLRPIVPYASVIAGLNISWLDIPQKTGISMSQPQNCGPTNTISDINDHFTDCNNSGSPADTRACQSDPEQPPTADTQLLCQQRRNNVVGFGPAVQQQHTVPPTRSSNSSSQSSSLQPPPSHQTYDITHSDLLPSHQANYDTLSLKQQHSIQYEPPKRVRIHPSRLIETI